MYENLQYTQDLLIIKYFNKNINHLKIMNTYLMTLVKTQRINLIEKYICSTNKYINNETYNNLLHIAVATKNLELVKFIYEKSQISLYCQNIDKKTPLEMSYYIKKSEIYKFLTSVKKNYRITATPILNYNLDNIASTLKIKNKFIIKEIENSTKNGILNTGLFNLVYILKESYPNLDENLLRPLFNRRINCHSFYFNQNEIKTMKLLIRKIQPRRMIKMISEWFFTGKPLSSNFEALILLKREDIEMINTNKIKRIEQINSICRSILNKKTQKDFKLNGHRFQKILIPVCTSRMKYVLPKTNYDLIRYGEMFSNCVGNGIYANRINENEIRIVIIFKDNLPFACVEIFYPSMKIGSYKGINNMSEVGEYDFQDLLFKIKENNKIKLMLDYILF